MVYKRHWLLSFGGTVANGQDIWSNNIRMTNDETGQPDTVPGSTLETLLDDYVADIRAFIGNTNAYIYNGVTCSWVKFNEIGPDGHYVDKTTTHLRVLNGTGNLAPIFGTAGTPTPPSYQSVCVTTLTDRARGPASKGRLYLPQCAAPLQGPGRMTSTVSQNIATAAASFFTALGDEAGVDVTAMRPAVVSNVGNPGPTSVITKVKVGDVPDVIRRRKNNLVEAYATANVS